MMEYTNSFGLFSFFYDVACKRRVLRSAFLLFAQRVSTLVMAHSTYTHTPNILFQVAMQRNENCIINCVCGEYLELDSGCAKIKDKKKQTIKPTIKKKKKNKNNNISFLYVRVCLLARARDYSSSSTYHFACSDNWPCCQSTFYSGFSVSRLIIVSVVVAVFAIKYNFFYPFAAYAIAHLLYLPINILWRYSVVWEYTLY